MTQSYVEEILKSQGTSNRAAFQPWRACALAVAATAVAMAIHVNDGEYAPLPMALITLGMIAAIFAVVGVNLPESWMRGKPVVRTLAVCLAIQFIALFITWPGRDMPHHGGLQLVPLDLGLLAAIAILLIGLTSRSPAIRIFWFPALLVLSLLLNFWVVHSSPNPNIDVWVFQQDAAAQLLHGHNPYAMTFPDIYNSLLPGHRQVYADGLVIHGRLQFGFVYPPMSLFMATIGYALAGDARYGQAVAIVLAGLFIGYSRPGRIAKLAATLLLFTPRIYFVLGRAWTEPFAVMLLAAVIFCACRNSKLLFLALGLLLATKQYLVLAVPLSFYLLPAGWRWRDWFFLLLQSLLVAVAVTLPMALWDFHAFWKSTVTVQELAPFRWDALSYLVWYGLRGHDVAHPSIVALASALTAITAMALSLWRSPRTPAGFAMSLSLLSLAFFAFNKQAFCNYYFFVIGVMCCAIGASAISFTDSTPVR